MTDTAFAFDLDGTVTRQEILPMIAAEIGLREEIGLLTRHTLAGTIPFADSFRIRCAVLRSVPTSTVRRIVASVPLDPDIEAFIRANAHRCAVVTGNLRCWISPLIDRLGCTFFASDADDDGERLGALTRVLDKGEALGSPFFGRFRRVVAIGDSHNDIPMFAASHTRIAFGGTHAPLPQLVDMADYVVYDGGALCRLLNTL